MLHKPVAELCSEDMLTLACAVLGGVFYPNSGFIFSYDVVLKAEEVASLPVHFACRSSRELNTVDEANRRADGFAVRATQLQLDAIRDGLLQDETAVGLMWAALFNGTWSNYGLGSP